MCSSQAVCSHRAGYWSRPAGAVSCSAFSVSHHRARDPQTQESHAAALCPWQPVHLSRLIRHSWHFGGAPVSLRTSDDPMWLTVFARCPTVSCRDTSHQAAFPRACEGSQIHRPSRRVASRGPRPVWLAASAPLYLSPPCLALSLVTRNLFHIISVFPHNRDLRPLNSRSSDEALSCPSSFSFEYFWSQCWRPIFFPKLHGATFVAIR